jgi:hypothetical protein
LGYVLAAENQSNSEGGEKKIESIDVLHQNAQCVGKSIRCKGNNSGSL